jgi:hypothetical protein
MPTSEFYSGLWTGIVLSLITMSLVMGVFFFWSEIKERFALLDKSLRAMRFPAPGTPSYGNDSDTADGWETHLSGIENLEHDK